MGILLLYTVGLHNTVAQHLAHRPHAARRKVGCSPLDSTENVSVLTHNLFTVACLLIHGCEQKNLAVVSVKHHDFQGASSP